MNRTTLARGRLVLALLVTSVLAAPILVNAATAAAPTPPQNTVPPTITGTPAVAQTLTAQEGQWTGSRPITFAYRWQRCDAQGANCVNIAGATAKTYVVGAADVANRLRVRITATNRVGTRNATSAPTAVVTVTPGTSVGVETVNPPERLLISSVVFTPNRIRSLSQQTSIRVRVTTTRGVPVRGAFVFVRSTPIVTSTPPEQATGTDGSVTFIVTPERDLRLFFRPGYNLQFFVRARKPGENPLAGISTRRLVQVPLTAGR